MRAMLCGCRRRVEAQDEERLVEELLAHLTREHPAPAEGPKAAPEWVRQAVRAHSYRIEHSEPYADGSGPEEEFGPEPY